MRRNPSTIARIRWLLLPWCGYTYGDDWRARLAAPVNHLDSLLAKLPSGHLFADPPPRPFPSRGFAVNIPADPAWNEHSDTGISPLVFPSETDA